MARSLLIAVLLGTLPGCADKIGSERPDAAPEAVDAPAGKVQTTAGSDAAFSTVINATFATDWVYVDFRDGSEVAATASWDLRFQRFHISTNGGISGTAGVRIAPVTGVAFAAMTEPPTTGYLEDAADDDDEDTLPEYALDQGDSWYDYNDETHVLTPRTNVWAVTRADATSFKFEILEYYDDAGTSGVFTLHWAPL